MPSTGAFHTTLEHRLFQVLFITLQHSPHLLHVVVDVSLNKQHLCQGRVEEAVFIQDVPDHPQSTAAQVPLLHQVLLEEESHQPLRREHFVYVPQCYDCDLNAQ